MWPIPSTATVLKLWNSLWAYHSVGLLEFRQETDLWSFIHIQQFVRFVANRIVVHSEVDDWSSECYVTMKKFNWYVSNPSLKKITITILSYYTRTGACRKWHWQNMFAVKKKKTWVILDLFIFVFKLHNVQTTVTGTIQ